MGLSLSALIDLDDGDGIDAKSGGKLRGFFDAYGDDVQTVLNGGVRVCMHVGDRFELGFDGFAHAAVRCVEKNDKRGGECEKMGKLRPLEMLTCVHLVFPWKMKTMR